MGGRAAWPTVRLTCGAEERCGAAPRGHARDGFKRFIATGGPGNDRKAVFIKFPRDVRQSSVELYILTSEVNWILTLQDYLVYSYFMV